MEDLNGGSLAPPAGAADLQYGNPQPGLALPPSGLQALDLMMDSTSIYHEMG